MIKELDTVSLIRDFRYNTSALIEVLYRKAGNGEIAMDELYDYVEEMEHYVRSTLKAQIATGDLYDCGARLGKKLGKINRRKGKRNDSR